MSGSDRPGLRPLALLRSFGLFWWDFVVGDDWRVAAGVVVALTVTAVLSHQGVPMWWFVPLAVVAIVAMSLRRASRPRP